MRNGLLILFCSIVAISSNTITSSTKTDPCQPQQVHLALSDAFYTDNSSDTQIKIIFHTLEDCSSAYIQLTSTGGQSISITSDPVQHFTASYEDGEYSTYIHVFEQSGLAYNQVYHYSCYGSSGTSLLTGPFEFFLPSPDPIETPTTVIMIGDFDSSSDGKDTLTQLQNISQANFTNIAAIVHMGDIAYDLESEAGTNGDNYMNAIQGVVSNIPYIITPGNHETLDNFSNVNSRFQMPLYSQSQNHFYSWNLNNIHFASINFDLFIFNDNNTVFLEEMANWLDNDLSQANETRDIRPWIVVYSHRPLYCSKKKNADCETNSQRFAVIDDLLFKYKVDLYMSGHVHVYERMFPIYNNTVYGFYEPNHHGGSDHNIMVNPEATIHIVQGIAGHSGDKNDKKLPKQNDFTVVVGTTYSLVALHSLNNTCLYIENIESETASLLDFLYLIKDPNYPTAPNENDFEMEIAVGKGVLYGLFMTAALVIVLLVIGAVWLMEKWRQGRRISYAKLDEQTNGRTAELQVA